MAQIRKNSNIRVLSLDGGGIRGISSLYILRRLFYRLNKQLKHDGPRQDIQPWEYFDLIGGSSTGGIAALLLGRLHLTIDECIELYKKLGEEMFGDLKKTSSWDKFSAEKLQNLILEAIRKKYPDSNPKDVPLIDPKDPEPRCRAIVYTLSSYDVNCAKPRSARTYASNFEEPGNICTIFEAISATSAALACFNPLEVASKDIDDFKRRVIDASIGHNNPSSVLRSEARDVFGSKRVLQTESFGMFMSIGTGVKPTQKLEKKNTLYWPNRNISKKAIDVLQELATDTEKVHITEENSFRMIDGEQSPYQRLNVAQDLGDIKLSAYERIPEIDILTHKYLNQTMNIALDKIVDDMEKTWLIAQETPPYQLSDSELEHRMERLRRCHPCRADIQQCIQVLRNDHSLLVQGLTYWSSLTLREHQIYNDIHRLMHSSATSKTSLQDIDILQFSKYLGHFSPKPRILKEMWQRFRRDIREPLQKSFILALLYMLHIEVFRENFHFAPLRLNEDGYLDDDRLQIVKSFAEWAPCQSPKGCSLKWNFAGENWGICKGTQDPAVLAACPIYKRYQEREENKMVMPGKKIESIYTVEEQIEFRRECNECYASWRKMGAFRSNDSS